MEIIRLREPVRIRRLTPKEQADRGMFNVATARGNLREMRRRLRAKRARLMNLANAERRNYEQN